MIIRQVAARLRCDRVRADGLLIQPVDPAKDTIISSFEDDE